MKKRLLFIGLLALLVNPCALAKEVKVTIPQFKVTLNDNVINNTNREYPLIVYNDITYFPMTYYDCRTLGMETKWTKEEGLAIEKTDVIGGYRDYEISTKNKSQYTATVTEGKITVNGKSINNEAEEYPLLLFRNVTYFPLTWRFAVDEFRWDYKFDNTNGLYIKVNKYVKSIEDMYDAIAFTIIDGDMYILTQNEYSSYKAGNKVIRYSIKEGKITDEIKVPESTGISNNEDGNLLLRKTNNGTTTLSYAVIDTDGKIIREYSENARAGINRENKTTITSPDGIKNVNLIFSSYIGPNSYEKNINNLTLVEGEVSKKIGNSDASYDQKNAFLSNNNELFVYAITPTTQNFPLTGEHTIHKINLNTLEVTKIASNHVYNFYASGDYIYYFTNENTIYKIDIKNSTETYVPNFGSKIEIFISDSLVGISDSQLCKLVINNDKVELIKLNEGAKLDQFSSVTGGVITQFDESPTLKYPTMIFDTKGELIVKLSDSTEFISGEEGYIYYKTKDSDRIYYIYIGE